MLANLAKSRQRLAVPFRFQSRRAIYSDYSNQNQYESSGLGGQLRSTTVLCVMIADGQVSLGNTVCKGNAIKVRRLGEKNDILVGMAGGAADCLTLIELLEGFIRSSGGDLTLACINFVKAWRTEKLYRQLNGQLCVADKEKSLIVSGSGEVIEMEGGIMAIGSGGLYALSSAKALHDIEGMDAHAIAKKSMNVASELCVYTNSNYTVETLEITTEIE